MAEQKAPGLKITRPYLMRHHPEWGRTLFLLRRWAQQDGNDYARLERDFLADLKPCARTTCTNLCLQIEESDRLCLTCEDDDARSD